MGMLRDEWSIDDVLRNDGLHFLTEKSSCEYIYWSGALSAALLGRSTYSDTEMRFSSLIDYRAELRTQLVDDLAHAV